MITFNHITEVGRGRLFFRLNSNGSGEELLLTTTQDWVLKEDGQELLLSGSGEALSWALKNKLCSSRREFLEHWVDRIRIPHRGVTPEVRLFPEGTTDTSELSRSHSFPCPTRRAQELIQHPIFNHCVLKYGNGENSITLTPALRDKVVSMAVRIHETDYYAGAPVSFPDGSQIQHASDGPNIEQFNLVAGELECTVDCFAVLQGADLPFDFKTRTVDESTWIRVPDYCEIWNESTITKLTTAAIAVCLHYQINDANIYGLDEHPLALHGLGCWELAEK